MFHHNTAKLLFLYKRARPNIQLAVAFLCTWVQKSDTDDYKKLPKVMKYSEATIGFPLILGVDENKIVKWYVNTAFTVHNNMKNHTGAIMTFGRGSAYSQSSKQKLNT